MSWGTPFDSRIIRLFNFLTRKKHKMQIKKSVAAILAALGLTVIATPAISYEAGDIIVRGRIINVDPQDSSGKISVNGAKTTSGVAVNSDTMPEVDFTYMIDKNWGVELILAYTDHDISTTSGGLSGLDNIISAKVLPPTLTLQYHFSPDSNIRPYVGAGINYTHFFDEKLTGPIKTLSDDIDLQDSWGLAAQAGVDIDIDDTWFVNLDVKYIDIDTTAHITDGADIRVNAEVDPIVWGIGIGRVF